MGRKAEEKLSQFVDSLVSVGKARLTATLGTDEATAAEVMRIIAHDICLLYPRQHIYVPLDKEFELSARDKNIWAEYGTDSVTARKFTQSRVQEIARQHGLTEKQVYCIVKLMRQREREAAAKDMAERQGVLNLSATSDDSRQAA